MCNLQFKIAIFARMMGQFVQIVKVLTSFIFIQIINKIAILIAIMVLINKNALMYQIFNVKQEPVQIY